MGPQRGAPSDFAVLAVPVSFLVSAAARRVQRALAVETLLRPSRLPDAESVRAALARALGDRGLTLALWSPELGAFVLAQPGGVALEVFDQRIHDIAMRQGPYREAWAAGAIMPAGSAGLPLSKAIEEMQSIARSGKDPLGRTRFGPPLEAPFFASWVTGALAHTQGGLAVDAKARVMRADGTPIEGLFASGGAAAGLAGRGGEGYLPGNGLAQSFALSLIAGEQIGEMRALLGRRA